MKSGAAVKLVAVATLMLLGVRQSVAWGSDGHRMINRLAAQTLPKDVPEFLRSASAVDAIEYYGPEPDHWKSQAELELSAVGSADHFMDMEPLEVLGGPLPRKRYDYIRALAYAQAKHPDMALSPEKMGFQPYRVDEDYERLKSAMRDYRGLGGRAQGCEAAGVRDCVSGRHPGALCRGWLAAAAYLDLLQRVDGREPERVYDRAPHPCAV